MSAPVSNAAALVKGSAMSTTTAARSIPARLPPSTISPPVSSSLQNTPATSSTSMALFTSQRAKETTTASTSTTMRSAVAPGYPCNANTKGLEACLPLLQAAANRAGLAAPSRAPKPLLEDNVQSRQLLSSCLKTAIVAGAATHDIRSAYSENHNRDSSMRDRATLKSSSQQGANWGHGPSAEGRDSEDDQLAQSPLRTLASLPQRTQELCEDLITLDSLVEADEAFFSAQEGMEGHVMELLRSWREPGSASDSRGGSRRPSGVYPLAAASHPSAAGAQLGDAVASCGSGGTQRVLHDFDEARDRIALLAKLHEELSELEEQHRGLQRRYVVEKSALSALNELCARLDEEDEAVREDGDGACYVEAAERVGRGAHRDGRSKTQEQQECDVVRAGLAACRLLADQLRSRGMMIADRLTNELLCLRSELVRHDWAALQSSTPLTRMDRVAPLDGRDDSPITITSASRFAPLLQLAGGAAAGRGGKESADIADSDDAYHFSEVAGGAHDDEANESDHFRVTATALEATKSVVFRVHVPVFASATPPALVASLPDAMTTATGGAAVAATSCTPRVSGDGPRPASSAERMRGRSSGAAEALSIASTTTVSVIASPARYALVQLYECCREGLAAMLTRLCTLRARRTTEVERLQQDQSAMDVYDPAADDLADRCAALLRYVAQLDEWVGEVLRMDQVLHERVKLPLDAALQSYDQLRTLLLEVLKQRLEDEEGRGKEHVAAVVDAEEEGGEVDGRGAHYLPHERVCSGDKEGLHALQVEDGEEDGGDQHRMSGSVGDSRARGATLSLAKASSDAAPRPVLPRASAEFIGVLEALLQDQKAAGRPIATAAVFTGDTSGGERELDTGEHSSKDGVLSKVPPALAQRLSTAEEEHNVGTSALVGVEATAEAEPVSAQSATHWPRATATVVSGKANASEATGIRCDRQSEGVGGGHLAGRRRQRDPSEDESEVTPHSAPFYTPEPTDTDALDPTSTSAPPYEITVYVSSTSCSELEEELMEEMAMEQSVSHTQEGMHGLSKRLGHERDDSDGGKEDSDSDSSDDSQRGREGNSNPEPQRQRYGLGSGSGLGEGLRALFSSVVRRAVSFGDSDDDADETGRTTPFQGREQGGKSPTPLHKRARCE
uniref:Uncharacterized protein n=1 Tax=Leishmania guyanensis TaxID=5670 RepID=A0A1E1IRI4_LEIGU|nr:hypothetical protein, unknown function [Leishmania guyanensis]